MGRYTGPVCRLCRAQSLKLFLKGERCFTPRCAIERRKSPPGDKSMMQRRRRLSEHGMQLREKQKARHIYGVFEKQFRKYLEKAARSREVTGTALMQLLERRLDNVVYRLGFSDSRAQARQTVKHGHIRVNGRRATIPSYQVRPGDVVTWKEQSKETGLFKMVSANLQRKTPPGWLKMNPDDASGEVVSVPDSSEIDSSVDTRLIVEFYSRR